jgi:predicted  nucleic acid-binding Zn-ribbon protein
MSAKKRLVSASRDAGMLKKLTQEVNALKRKEKSTQQKLTAALAKAKKMAKSFATKLEKKTLESKAKMAAAEAAIYHKIASSIQKKAKKTRAPKTLLGLQKGTKKNIK